MALWSLGKSGSVKRFLRTEPLSVEDRVCCEKVTFVRSLDQRLVPYGFMQVQRLPTCFCAAVSILSSCGPRTMRPPGTGGMRQGL